MHWIYKVASALVMILTVAAGGLYALNCEDTYPSGPEQDVKISDAHGHTLSDMLGIADKHHVMLAKVTSESNAKHGFERQITVFGSSDAYAPFVKTSPYPDYGFNACTVVRQGDELTNPLGRWLIYGHADDAQQAAAAIQAKGFELNGLDAISVPGLVGDFFSNSIASIITAGIVITFIAAAVSASASSRISAVQELHGTRRVSVIARQGLQHMLFVLGTMGAGWLIWIAIGLICWPHASPFVFAGQVFLGIMSVTAIVAMLAALAAIIIIRLAVPGIIAQIKGKRPLRFLMVASCLATIVVLNLTMVGMNNAIMQRNSTEAMSTSLTRHTSQPGFRLLLWFSNDRTRAQYMPNWNAFVDRAANAGRIRFFFSQENCTWVDGGQAPNSTCIIMDPKTAEQQHLLASSSRTAVTVLMPADDTYDPSSIIANVLSSYAFEQDIAASNHQSLPDITAQDVTVTTISKKAAPWTFNTMTDNSRLHTPVIILDAQLLSGDTTTAMASAGGMMFTYQSRRAVITALRDAGALPLVSSAIRPCDEIANQLAVSRQETIFFTIVAVIAFACSLGIGVMLALIMCTLRRQVMFVEFIHGATSRLRFGTVALLVLALCAMVVLPCALMRLNIICLAAPMAFAITTMATTAVYDSQLRADSIKHP
ncbi:hypothetical protein KIH75_03235 [Bifidobacterium sp. 64T4]|uniref:hypothetical protein n=1 Tax=Bifidobacterium pongonis TaxID=2834432 RepID=UPI001C589594|nr:hypothetical protein [Bifidobacterium pongonis]MBW3094379.1 hypothetical protein [Bifidobacterium pongonis]